MHSKSGCYNSKSFHLISKNKKKFIERDKGGAIYILPSDSFYSIPKKRLGRCESVSKKAIIQNRI